MTGNNDAEVVKLLRRYPALRPVPPALHATLLERARKRSQVKAGLFGLVMALLAAIVSIPVLGGTIAVIVAVTAASLGEWAGAWAFVLPVGGFIAYFAGLAIIIVAVVQAVDRGLVRRALRMELGHNRCVQCGYSLAGLKVDEGSGLVTCPECATRLFVANGVAMIEGEPER